MFLHNVRQLSKFAFTHQNNCIQKQAYLIIQTNERNKMQAPAISFFYFDENLKFQKIINKFGQREYITFNYTNVPKI